MLTTCFNYPKVLIIWTFELVVHGNFFVIPWIALGLQIRVPRSTNHKQWIILTIAQFSLWHVRARIGIEKDWRKSGKMTSFDPSETDYGYPLYTYGQYYGGYPLYTHPPTPASRSVVESVPLSVTPGTTPGAVASVSLLLYCVRRT